MNIPLNEIVWSEKILSKDGINTSQIGICIEDSSSSLRFTESDYATVDLSVWFKSTTAVKSVNHELKVNGVKKECLSIDITEKDILNNNNIVLIYFENFKINRDTISKIVKYSINLDKVTDFYNKYNPIGFLVEKSIEILARQEYTYIFYNIDNTIEEKIKYYNIPFSLYSKDYNEQINFLKSKNKNFLGWKNAKNEEFYFDNRSQHQFNFNEDMSFSPIIEDMSFSIYLYDNDGTSNVEVVQYTTNFDLAKFTRSRIGYDFEGWSISNTPFAEKFNGVFYPDIILYAIWKRKDLKICYVNDSNIIEEVFKYNEVIKITNKIPISSEGYKFLGWHQEYKEPYLNGEIIKWDDSIMTWNPEKECFYLEFVPYWGEEIYNRLYYESMTGKSVSNFDNELKDIQFEDEGKIYSQWSYKEKDNNVIFKTGDTLPKRDTILYSVETAPVKIIYHYGQKSAVEETREYSNQFVDNTTLYNDMENLIDYTILYPPESMYSSELNRNYFCYWSATINKEKDEPIYVPGNIATLPVSIVQDAEGNEEKQINLYARYLVNNDVVEHSILIDSNRNLIAENFNEDDNFSKENGSFPFFTFGTINAKEFIEQKEEEDSKNSAYIYNTGDNAGKMEFTEIQQGEATKQILLLSLDFNKLIFDDNNTENIDVDDTYLAF